jgi:CheY-like chemotaxis protein
VRRWTSSRRSRSCWSRTTLDCAVPYARSCAGRQGHQVHEVADGAEALALAAAALPDVIVTDLNMPVVDGAAFIQRCRAMPGLHQVPIIVMSAAERDSMDCLTAAQVNAYLVKPFDLVDLTIAIEGRART